MLLIVSWDSFVCSVEIVEIMPWDSLCGIRMLIMSWDSYLVQYTGHVLSTGE